jgi:23S rRNA pseudouridine955/2504/2580 synthase
MNHGTGPDKGTRQTGVQKIVVDEEQAGQRIDNFLRRQLPGLPKGRLYRILRRGEVRVNGGRIRAEYKLVAGDEVRIPPARINADPDAPAAGKVADLEQQVLYEDKRLLVINKPSGVAVHGGSGVSHGVIELMRAARPELRDLALVHRRSWSGTGSSASR